jgi:hypothetical protein
VARWPAAHGETGPARPGGQPTAHVPEAARWRVGRVLTGGWGAAKCSTQAPPLRGGYVGQRERRRGSPRRSGDDGVAGSGRRGGVLMEGGSGGVAASSGAVLWLEVEAREGTVGAASERRRKHGGSTLLKGG